MQDICQSSRNSFRSFSLGKCLSELMSTTQNYKWLTVVVTTYTPTNVHIDFKCKSIYQLTRSTVSLAYGWNTKRKNKPMKKADLQKFLKKVLALPVPGLRKKNTIFKQKGNISFCQQKSLQWMKQARNKR